MAAPQRIAIVGTSGAGKTTLGREIARRMNTVFVEIDAIQHKANWVRATNEELRDGIEAQITGHECWVIDNTCWRPLGNFISKRTDIILWLDLPLPLKLARLCQRSWYRVRSQEPMWNGNTEQWHDTFVGKDSVLVFAVTSHFRQRRTLATYPDADKILRLRTRAEVKSWLESSFPLGHD